MRGTMILALLVVSMCLAGLPSSSFIRANQTSPVKADLLGTIDGSIDPSAIPDAVAYQLFFRASSTNLSLEFTKKAGLDDQQGKTFLDVAHSVVEILDDYDTAINTSEQYRVPKLRERREQYVAKEAAGLSRSLGDPLAARVNSYIRTEIKGKIKKIPLSSILKKEKSNLTSVYTYSDSWRENGFVYGVSVIMPDNDYLTDMVFEASTTILGPGGIRSSSSSTLGSSIAVDLTRLLVGKYDGEYTVASSFAVSRDSHKHHVSGSMHILDVAQTVSIGTASGSPVPPTSINSTTGVATITASITTTVAVPSTAIATVELDEVENTSGVVYDIITVDNGAETAGRSQTVHLAGGGASKTVTWRIKTTTANQAGGNIVSKVILDSAFACVPNTQGCTSNPADIKTAPTSSGNLTVLVATPSGGGSGEPSEECEELAESNGFAPGPTVPYCEYGYEPAGYCDCCVAISPIVIDVLGNGYSLTGTNNPVSFDFNGSGSPVAISWTRANSDDAFLVLDRDGNGTIDNGAELFGNVTPQPLSPHKNGFLALAEYDKPLNGGNNDGKINRADAIFASLRLWQDTNHNGISEASELYMLPALNVLAIDLDYQESRRQDSNGNLFRYRAKVRDAQGASVGRCAWDVFFVKQ